MKKKKKLKKPGHFGGLYGGMILSSQFGSIELQEGGGEMTSTGGVSGVTATGGGT